MSQTQDCAPRTQKCTNAHTHTNEHNSAPQISHRRRAHEHTMEMDLGTKCSCIFLPPLSFHIAFKIAFSFGTINSTLRHCLPENAFLVEELDHSPCCASAEGLAPSLQASCSATVNFFSTDLGFDIQKWTPWQFVGNCVLIAVCQKRESFLPA